MCCKQNYQEQHTIGQCFVMVIEIPEFTEQEMAVQQKEDKYRQEDDPEPMRSPIFKCPHCICICVVVYQIGNCW